VANTLKECIKSLKDRLLSIEQISLLEEKSTLRDLKFDVDNCDSEVLEQIALYHLNIYDVTYHGKDFVFLRIKRSMEDGQDGWFKATKRIAKDNFAVTMYKDVKRGQEKYSDAKIVKDPVSLIDDNKKLFSDCDLSRELIATIVKKKMYYLLLPVQFETLLDESEKVQVDEDISLFDVFTNVGEINSPRVSILIILDTKLITVMTERRIQKLQKIHQIMRKAMKRSISFQHRQLKQKLL